MLMMKESLQHRAFLLYFIVADQRTSVTIKRGGNTVSEYEYHDGECRMQLLHRPKLMSAIGPI